MSVRQGSRYTYVGSSMLIDNDDKWRDTLHPRVPALERTANARPYKVQVGDSFQSIARRTLGDPQRWWILADMNTNVFFPLSLTPGEIIYIPTMSEAILIEGG